MKNYSRSKGKKGTTQYRTPSSFRVRKAIASRICAVPKALRQPRYTVQ